jgi:hypothetical protein
MKFWLVTLLNVAMSGCATQTTVAYRGNPMDRCSMVAEQRERDGAANGYDQSLQKAVYRDTYADCVKWNAAHDIGTIDRRSQPLESRVPPM